MKKLTLLLVLVLVFSVLLSCKNTPLDKVLDNKKENSENYKNNIMPIQEQEKVADASKDVVKVAHVAQGTPDPGKIGSLYGVKGSGPASSGKPFYSIFEEKQKNFGEINHFSMSYNAAPIGEIIPVFAKVLGFDFYLDPNVKGVVTLTVDSNLSKKEIWMIFEQILLFTGSYCSMDNGVVHILPLSMMSQERRLGPGFGYEANVSVVLFRLNNAKSSALVQQLKPFMTNGAVLIDMADQNSVLVVETPSNVPKLKAIVGMLDVSTRVAWPKTVIRCINVPPTRIADELTKLLPVLGLPVQDVSTPDSASAKKDLTPGAINIQGVDRLQLLVVSAANNEVIDEVKRWVDVLDRNDVGDQYQVYVYNVLYGRAEDLIQTLSVIFNVQGAILTPPASSSSAASSGGTSASPFSVSSGSSGSSSSSSLKLATAYDVTQLTQKQDAMQQEDPKNPKKTPVNAFDVPSSIMSDAVNQRLVIKAAPRTYAIMKALLDRIDTIPKQVLLDVMIADVVLTNNTTIGTEFKDSFGSSTVGTSTGISGTRMSSPGLDNPLATGFEYMLLDQGKKSIVLQALQKNNRATTLAAPQILVQSNTQAKIMIGQEVPISTGSVSTQVTAGQLPATNNTYTYKNVGIIVNATPRITRGNFISIDFNEVLSDTQSSGVLNSSGQPINPTINSRQLTTTLVLPDKGTILIGGLIKDKRTDNLNTVPFFGNIPFVNRLIGKTQADIERTEMLVLLTVSIINKTSDVEAMSERYKESINGMNKLFSEDWKDANQVFEQEEQRKIYVK